MLEYARTFEIETEEDFDEFTHYIRQMDATYQKFRHEEMKADIEAKKEEQKNKGSVPRQPARPPPATVGRSKHGTDKRQ